MNTQRIDILTPVGRLVAGDPFTANTTDPNGRPLTVKNGPNAGQPRTEYYLAIAIPKSDPTYNTEILAKLQLAAKQGFPTLFGADGNCIRPDFAWKVVDGDSQIPNQNNVKPCDKEGFPGHWVISFKGGFAPKVYTKGGEAIITDPEQVKRGYYIRIYGSVAANGDSSKPGLFLNPNLVELVGYGEEIVSGPDGSAVFGGTPVANLPAGASPTPLAGTPIQQTPAPAQTPVVTPAPDFLNNAPQTPAPAAPAAPVVKTYSYQGQTFTEEQLKANGWTDEHIATHAQLIG